VAPKKSVKTYDKTQGQRSQKRRAALDEIAKAAGYESWSGYSTQILNGKATINQVEDTLDAATRAG
jgi:hypothetical protein